MLDAKLGTPLSAPRETTVSPSEPHTQNIVERGSSPKPTNESAEPLPMPWWLQVAPHGPPAPPIPQVATISLPISSDTDSSREDSASSGPSGADSPSLTRSLPRNAMPSVSLQATQTGTSEISSLPATTMAMQYWSAQRLSSSALDALQQRLHPKRNQTWSFSGNVAHTYREHSGAIRSVAVHHTERLFLSAARDDLVKCWDIHQPDSQSVVRVLLSK